MNRQYYVYIMTCKSNKALYTGVTNDMITRTYQHKKSMAKGFTSRYNIDRLIYFEIYEDPEEAIKREKQIKAGSRKKKELLINKTNPEWKDLYPEIIR